MDKIKKLEKEIKELNARRADYRKEMEEAEHELRDKKTSPEHVARLKAKFEERSRSINEKIVALRSEIDELRRG